MSVDNPVSSLATPSVMNRETALARMGGDERLLLQMADFFLTDAATLVAELDEAVRTGNVRGGHHAAHSLKGLAANFEALPAIAAARQIELSCRDGNLEACVPLMPRLKDEIARLSAALQAMMSHAG